MIGCTPAQELPKGWRITMAVQADSTAANTLVAGGELGGVVEGVDGGRVSQVILQVLDGALQRTTEHSTQML